MRYVRIEIQVIEKPCQYVCPESKGFDFGLIHANHLRTYPFL